MAARHDLVGVDRSRVELPSHREEVAGLRGQLQVATAQQMIDSAKAQLGVEFQAAASKALQSNNEQFVQLANANLGKTLESAKSEFHQRHQQFQELVKPLAENYGKLNPQIETLTTQVSSITAETAKLSGALTDNRQVGSWGEMAPRRGTGRHGELLVTANYRVDRERPDMVAEQPRRSPKHPAAYLEAQQADDEPTANAAWSKPPAPCGDRWMPWPAKTTATGEKIRWISW